MKERIQAIQIHRIGGKLSIGQKLIFPIVGLIVLPFLLCIGLFNAPSSWAQSPTGSKASFEVASIRVAENCGNTAPGVRAKIPSGASYQPGGRFTICGQLRWIIMEAYQIKLFSPLTGVPAWSDDILYKIETKAEGNPDKEQMHLMVQSLLEDRFKLKIHRETLESAVYLLVVAKRGHKLQPAKDEQGNSLTSLPPPDPNQKNQMNKLVIGGSFSISEVKSMLMPGKTFALTTTAGGEFIGKAITVTRLADALYSMVGSRKVIDNTGLAGLYDIELVYGNPFSGPTSPDPTGSAPPPEPLGPSIFTALQEQLGLKLETSTGPVDRYIIDSVEKPSDD